jgi:hypothetical protein
MNIQTPPEFTMAVRCLDGRYSVVACSPLGICLTPASGTHKTINGAIRAEWRDYERRVRVYEEQGCTRSDAQGIVDAQMLSFSRMLAESIK